jgi:nucleoid-associated protein YgaU
MEPGIMAKETRIGLLVGLFFIVMFGVVLTELTGGNKSALAPLDTANEATRIAALPVSEDTSPSVAAPRESVARIGPPSSKVITPTVAAPSGQSPAAAEGKAAEPQQVASAGPSQDAAAAPPDKVSALLSAVETPPAPAGSEELTASLKTIAAKEPSPTAGAELAAAAPVAKERTYTVQPKDTLRKIAKTVYGPDKEKEYRRIFEANKGTLKSESVLSVGQVLVVPALPGQASSPGAAQAGTAGGSADRNGTRVVGMDQLQKQLASQDVPQAKATADGPRQAASETAKTPKASRVYVVAAGDNLSKIARKTLGNDKKATIAKLCDANRGKLGNSQRLTVGTKLEIPD